MRLVTLAIGVLLWTAGSQTARPFLTSELLFPLEHWHNHGSTVVELPGGDLLACWFHGSGERTADDVVVLGARLPKGETRRKIIAALDMTRTKRDKNPPKKHGNIPL